MRPPILIDTAEGRAYLSETRSSGGMVALLGSGISTWHPSNIPTGQKITDALADVIASHTISPRTMVLDCIRHSAFEHIMERYPKPEILQSTVARAFYPTPPNPVHEAFARLVDAGVIEHIITTNYDVGLEAACAAICRSAKTPQVIVTESNLAGLTTARPTLFKIHGCASPGREASLVLTLGGEGEMPSWKRELLELLINGKLLLVCGYSGLDFEICPELARLTPTKTTWNSFQDPRIDENALTANARRVLQASGGTTLVGDMNKMLKTLTLHDCAKPSKITSDFVSQLAHYRTKNDVELWS